MRIHEGRRANIIYMGSTDIVQPVIFHEAFEKSLGLPPWFMDVVAGAIIANRMPGPAVRLALVGDRCSGIEEVVDSLAEQEGKKSESSLLIWREAEGGGLRNRDKQVGTLLELAEKAGAGIIASCSDHLARRLKESDTESPFLLLRAPDLPVKEAMGDEPEMRRELKNAMSALDSIQVPSDVPMSDDVRQWLAQLADFLTRLRTPVPRDPKTREVTDLPAVAPTDYLAKQFAQLIKGLTVVRELDQPYDDEVKLIERVAFSSVPPERLQVVQQLGRWGCGRVRPLSVLAGISRTVAHRILQDLRLLKLVKHSPRYGFVPADDFHLLFALAARRLADEYPSAHQRLA